MHLIQALVEIWARRHEPRTTDVQQALFAAETLEKDPSSPTHLRAFASHLVAEVHHSVEWDLPTDLNLPSCHAAAASLSHSASLLIEEIAKQIEGTASPVLVLGALAASRSIFGRWDLVPANGALLISLDPDDAKGRPDGADMSEVHSLRWAAPGRLRRVYEEYARPVDLADVQVLVPQPELIAARATMRHLRAEDPQTLVFYGAALASVGRGRWTDVRQIARTLGRRGMPTEIAFTLGIDQRLGLQISHTRRAVLTVRRLLRSRERR
jgi:hypothetical protein